MSEDGLLGLLGRVADILDELGVEYALGGSVASSFFGEPRSTADIDVAARLDAAAGEALLQRVSAEFYVPVDSARRAIRSASSFNLLDATRGLKVDVFVLGRGLLDRRQVERRVPIQFPDRESPIWVTSPEDQILRKLDWDRSDGSVSDRQWRDVVGLILNTAEALDLDYVRSTAGALGLADLVERAVLDSARA